MWETNQNGETCLPENLGGADMIFKCTTWLQVISGNM